jgi:hypothetical protein
MAFQISAGVVVSEIDLTTVVPSVSTTGGALVGAFQWGPADQRITVDGEVGLVSRFFEPDANTYPAFFTGANFLSYGSNLQVVRSVGANSRNATADGSGLIIKNRDKYEQNYYGGAGAVGVWSARYPGSLGNSLKISLCPSAQAFSNTIAGVTSNTTNGSTTVAFSANVSLLLAPGDLFRANSGTYVEVASIAANGLLGVLSSAYDATNTNGPIGKKWKYADNFNGAPGTSTYASNRAGSGDEMHVIVVDQGGLFTGTANTVLETFPYVSKAVDATKDDGSPNYVRDVILGKSNYAYWMGNLTAGTNWGSTAAGTTFTSVVQNDYKTLAGGVFAAPTDAEKLTGYDLFANGDETDISLLMTADASQTVALYAVALAESRKDCLTFVSPRSSDVVNNLGSENSSVVTYRNTLTSSSYAVMDNNWKYQFDKYNNVYRWVPLNGDTAGLCARTDTDRDPWWSPAGLIRGQIKNCIKLAYNPTKTNRDDLYKAGVNPVVTFPGEGTVLFGDKTMLARPSAFDRINVRRLFIVLEKSIARASRSSLFEFNDEFTRAQFVNMVEPFLRDVQGRRGITAFRVVCDESNNPQEVLDGDRFVGDIYIKPNRSINFIQLNFVAVRSGVEFNEIVGRF